MNVIGIGTEIVECLRIGQMIEQHGEKFLRRIYTGVEIEYCSARAQATQHYATYWAGKNAVLKALGVRMRPGMTWRDVEIRLEAGRHQVGLAGLVRDVSVAQAIDKIHIALSHCRTMAVAYSIAERDEGPAPFEI